jgi:hypothetical protein
VLTPDQLAQIAAFLRACPVGSVIVGVRVLAVPK